MPDQFSLFGDGADRLQAPARPQVDHPARAQTVFPQMAGWLPEEEAQQLRLQFQQQIERLSKAV